LKTIKINLPKKFEYTEGVTNPLYKKYDGWNKISYSQYTSFKDYKMGYLRDYILGMKEDEGGMFANFGSNCGDYLNPYDTGEYDMLSEADIEILDKIKKTHPENAEFEFEILIDLEPFGLEKTVLQGFTDRQHLTEDKTTEITDYKTLTIKNKTAFYKSEEYQQTNVYGYGLEELGHTIGKVYVTGLGRSGNNTKKGDKNVLRLSGEVVIIDKPYIRENGVKAIEYIAKTCIDISDYYKTYNKYFKLTL
jgi:hypothetical protein